MPNAPTAQLPKAGDTFYFPISGFTYHQIVKGQFQSLVSRRGDQVTITREFLDAQRDRYGNLAPWLGLLFDEPAQLRRYGQVIAVAGEFPLDYVRTMPGEIEHEEARRAALREAKSLDDEKERNAALRKIEQTYGPATPTSRTTARYAGDGEEL